MYPRPVFERFPFAPGLLLESQDYDEAISLLNTELGEQRIVTPLAAAARANVRLSLNAFPDIKLFGACWGDAVSVRSAPLSCWHGILPLTGGVSCNNNLARAGAGELLLFAPEHEIDITWADQTNAVVIALKTSLLREHLETVHQLALPQMQPMAMSIERDNPALRSMGNLLRMTDEELAYDSPLLKASTSVRQLQALFCESLLQLVPDLRQLSKRSLLPGSVKRAVNYIHLNLGQPITIDELVKVSNASRRSLELGFRDSLHTSPMRYVQQCRLEAARECLRRAAPGQVQLAEVADRFGFSQPSHFTNAYKQAFDELPSATLGRT